MAKNGTDLDGESSLVLGLARGLPYARIREETSLSLRTVCRRAKDPRIQAKVAEVRDRLLADITARLVDAGTEAVEAIKGLLESENEQIRLGAGKALLESLQRFRDSQKERLAQQSMEVLIQKKQFLFPTEEQIIQAQSALESFEDQ